MAVKTTTPFGSKTGEVQDVTLTPAVLEQLIQFPGLKALATLRVANDVVSATTVTIGDDVYEIEIVNTDSNDDAADGDFNNTTNPLTIADMSGYTNLDLAEGDLIRIENEIMRVDGVNGDKVRFLRGASGTTVATHANGTDIYVGDGVTAGRIALGMVATLTPTVFTAALVDDINTVGTEPVTAVLISVNEVLIHADTVGVVTTALAETLAGANNAWDTAALRVGAAAATKKIARVARVPNAQEVALGNLHVALDFTPAVVVVQVRVTASGDLVAWDGDCVIATGLVKLTNTGDVDWAATDTVHIVAFE